MSNQISRLYSAAWRGNLQRHAHGLGAPTVTHPFATAGVLPGLIVPNQRPDPLWLFQLPRMGQNSHVDYLRCLAIVTFVDVVVTLPMRCGYLRVHLYLDGCQTHTNYIRIGTTRPYFTQTCQNGSRESAPGSKQLRFCLKYYA